MFCTKDLNLTYFMCFLFLISSCAAQACVTGQNCVTNIPLKVIIQLGQRGFQQIMVAGRRTSCIYVNAGWVLERITCLMSHICHWWGLKFKKLIHFLAWLNFTLWTQCGWVSCWLLTCPGSLAASSCLLCMNYASCNINKRKKILPWSNVLQHFLQPVKYRRGENLFSPCLVIRSENEREEI